MLPEQACLTVRKKGFDRGVFLTQACSGSGLFFHLVTEEQGHRKVLMPAVAYARDLAADIYFVRAITSRSAT
jgi:hypothetical protein